MSDRTGIEYLDATWNPVVGCTHVSAGCRNCWAERMAKRWGQEWGSVRLRPERLKQPLHWRKPRRVGVCFMGDLFHEYVPNEFIVSVFQHMSTANHHDYFILTKRPARMRDWFAWCARKLGVAEMAPPPSSVFLGVSVEDQASADERIPILLQTPAARRWVSVEPMLGPVDLRKIDLGDGELYPLAGYIGVEGRGMVRHPRLDWVVLGGESGHGARPMHPDWARGVRDQCVYAAVPFNFKQWGEWAEAPPQGSRDGTFPYFDTAKGNAGKPPAFFVGTDGTVHCFTDARRDEELRPAVMVRIGKKRAGRVLDGRTWDEVPE